MTAEGPPLGRAKDILAPKAVQEFKIAKASPSMEKREKLRSSSCLRPNCANWAASSWMLVRRRGVLDARRSSAIVAHKKSGVNGSFYAERSRTTIDFQASNQRKGLREFFQWWRVKPKLHAEGIHKKKRSKHNYVSHRLIMHRDLVFGKRTWNEKGLIVA